MDVMIDVTTDDLQRFISLTIMHAEKQQPTLQWIQLSHCYTNGKHGPGWCVRQIIDESLLTDPNKDTVIYPVV